MRICRYRLVSFTVQFPQCQQYTPERLQVICQSATVSAPLPARSGVVGHVRDVGVLSHTAQMIQLRGH